MPKSGMHRNDANDQTKSKGPNKPSESRTITTGTYKKKEPYEERARMHLDPEPQAQAARNDWNPDTRDKPSIAGSTRARHPRSGRSGSDSNASSSTRGH